MEDALVQMYSRGLVRCGYVLILVLMEDALVHLKQSRKRAGKNSLNPCFNGRCTRTRPFVAEEQSAILVLILVLMEDALVLTALIFQVQNCSRLNPCFNGRCTRTFQVQNCSPSLSRS